MRRQGKSFWLASLMLPAEVAQGAARLYQFCRTMDDLADDSVVQSRVAELDAALDALRTGISSDPVMTDFLDLVETHDIPRDAAICLLETLAWDARGPVLIDSEEHLLRYCYGVAGTVGLMMSALLGCSPEAFDYGVHLGIAMQMTNIARDVLEDAQQGRRYLPAQWNCAYTPDELSSASGVSPLASIVASAIDRLLSLADSYYASAALGFLLIPPASRTSIRIAAALYREIGLQLRSQGTQWQRGRTVVPIMRRLKIATRVSLGGRSVEDCCSTPARPISPMSLLPLPGMPA